MEISRREFLKLVGVSAAALGLTLAEMGDLEKVLANPKAPSVLWLTGAGCSGCSVSFLNRISTDAPHTAGDVLIESINLAYHPTLMSATGNQAVDVLQKVYKEGNYILVIEGGVPTAFDGKSCIAWTYNGEQVTFKDAVISLAKRASNVVCIGTCASFGGVTAAPPNPTGVKGVPAVIGTETVNIPGCPPHPDWTVWAIVQLLLNKPITKDVNGRPMEIYGITVHRQCPRRGTDICLEDLGCKGKRTYANCPKIGWNNKVSWCIDANAPCQGCTDPTYPMAGRSRMPRGGRN
ncbi:MAG: twin-arginine translocation signal domain-containing protein [bacterium]